MVGMGHSQRRGMRRCVALVAALTLTACAAPSALRTTAVPATEISLGTPTPPPLDCRAGPTPGQTEGPYYKAGSPEDAVLTETMAVQTPITVTGYVLTADCQPIAQAWLDFWQADEAGQYDNQSYILRGHQYTDAEGRYTLATVLPGIYPGRTRHLHVKVQAPGQTAVLTTQLYFPEAAQLNAADGLYDARLLVTWVQPPAETIATFNFILAP